MAKIYVASSWRNQHYPEVVQRLREAGHEVYDFRNPPSGDPGFKWSSISSDYMQWSPVEYRAQLHHPKAERQFTNDIEAMLKKGIIRQSDKTYVLADSSKFDVISYIKFAELDEADIITDIRDPGKDYSAYKRLFFIDE